MLKINTNSLAEITWSSPKGKFAGAFGSYGWSGEAVGNLTARMEQLHLKVPVPGLRIRLKPSEEQLKQATAFGKEFAAAIREEA